MCSNNEQLSGDRIFDEKVLMEERKAREAYWETESAAETILFGTSPIREEYQERKLLVESWFFISKEVVETIRLKLLQYIKELYQLDWEFVIFYSTVGNYHYLTIRCQDPREWEERPYDNIYCAIIGDRLHQYIFKMATQLSARLFYHYPESEVDVLQ